MTLIPTKLKLAFATLALAFITLISAPNSSAQASSLINGAVTQSEQLSQPVEMQRRHGYRRHGGYRRHYGYGHRRMYRPRPYYGAYYAPRPAYCRTVVRHDHWGYPRYVRICR
jgi:hypothetical protein